jgi:hypothetical protein
MATPDTLKIFENKFAATAPGVKGDAGLVGDEEYIIEFENGVVGIWWLAFEHVERSA